MQQFGSKRSTQMFTSIVLIDRSCRYFESSEQKNYSGAILAFVFIRIAANRIDSLLLLHPMIRFRQTRVGKVHGDTVGKNLSYRENKNIKISFNQGCKKFKHILEEKYFYEYGSLKKQVFSSDNIYIYIYSSNFSDNVINNFHVP